MTPKEIRKFDAEEKNRLQTELDQLRALYDKRGRTISGTCERLRERQEATNTQATYLLSASLEPGVDETSRRLIMQTAAALAQEAAAYQFARDLIALYEVKPTYTD